MIAVCISFICVTYLVGQGLKFQHEIEMRAGETRLDGLEDRLAILEQRGHSEFSAAAFDELKSKVEALRIAQGLKRG